MRYQLEDEIDLPRARVVELLLDPQNLTKWQPDLLSVEQLAGEPGQVGAKSKQVNRQGKGELEIIETITVINHPGEFCATYEAGDVWNLIENRFYEVGATKTRWVLVSDFRTTNIMMKLMTLFAPSMFKKQTATFMNRFKEFAEATG
jgi:hypothetical protein